MTKLLYLFILILIIIGLIFLLMYIMNSPTNDYDKHSAYECGFEPFGDARGFFDAHFYVVGLLFVIFDLEVAFLIPFVIDIANVTILSYICFLLFMGILILGFYYEWVLGLLDWQPFFLVEQERVEDLVKYKFISDKSIFSEIQQVK